MSYRPEDIHPSHESYTGKPAHIRGERVIFINKRGEILDIRNIGSQESPLFQYKIRFDDGEESNWIEALGFRKES